MSQALTIPYAAQPDFLAAAQALLPPGDAWSQDADAELTELLNASVGWLARAHASAAQLTQIEAVPFLSQELLPAWEAAYGLPDPCSPLNATIAQRQAAVAARMQSNGGQTAEYFINVAAALGYEITVTTFTPAYFGQAVLGAEWYGLEWLYVWQVNAPQVAVFPSMFGVSRFGEVWESNSGSQLSCVLNRIKPAYSVLNMNYSGWTLQFLLLM